MVLGAHIQLCVTEPDFLENIRIRQKRVKKVKNDPKACVFGLFKKIRSLVLSEIGVK